MCDSLCIPERIRSLSNVNKDQSEWRLSPSQIILMASCSPIIELLFDKLNMNNSNFKDRFQDIDPLEKIYQNRKDKIFLAFFLHLFRDHLNCYSYFIDSCDT